ncbi:hypothetical protein [Methanobrevibacter sp.]|uniref:hypothetical protein n=1 Tax=Methanobrevibacter sp. TaxID=66852 RepID=UPI0025D72A3C|nr:hypothetical protein [Methanobrevibacter sp.]MBQ2961741.1 hypothetical protein [Methanobrevibacter sp.]
MYVFSFPKMSKNGIFHKPINILLTNKRTLEFNYHNESPSILKGNIHMIGSSAIINQFRIQEVIKFNKYATIKA